VIAFKDILGGNVYFDKSQNGYYKWSIQARNDIEIFQSYILKCPCFSNKKQRLFLIDQYFELKDLKAYSALPHSVLGKAWVKFNNKWNYRG
jgi:hypothetical protein